MMCSKIRRSIIPLLLLALLSAACGKREGSSGNPLNVSVSLDPSRAVAQVVGPTGGLASAVAADGTKFTLEIPKDALFQDTPITLTPVPSIAGLPFKGGLVGAIQFAPEGLRLFIPATLTIEPPTPIPLQGIEAFAYYGMGQDFHFYPLARNTQQLQVHVVHFSGTGITKATNEERRAQFQREPSQTEAILMQRLAQLLGMERQKQLLGAAEEGVSEDGGKLVDQIVRVKLDEWTKLMKSRGETDSEVTKVVMAEYLGWRRHSELLGGDDSTYAKETEVLERSFERAFEHHIRQVADRCDRGDSSAGVEIVAIERQTQLLGSEGAAGNLWEHLPKCAPKPKSWRGKVTYSRTEKLKAFNTNEEAEATIQVVEGGQGSWSAKVSRKEDHSFPGCHAEAHINASGSGKTVLHVFDFSLGTSPTGPGDSMYLRPQNQLWPDENELQLTLSFLPGGAYKINFGSTAVKGPQHFTSQGPNCPQSRRAPRPDYRLGISGEVEGLLNQANPYVISGSKKREQFSMTTTITWEFTREP